MKSYQEYESFKIPQIRILIYDISLICTKYGAFTVIGATVLKDCMYPLDQGYAMQSVGYDSIETC